MYGVIDRSKLTSIKLRANGFLIYDLFPTKLNQDFDDSLIFSLGIINNLRVFKSC